MILSPSKRSGKMSPPRKEMVTVNGKEQIRLGMSNQVEVGKTISREAMSLAATLSNDHTPTPGSRKEEQNFLYCVLTCSAVVA